MSTCSFQWLAICIRKRYTARKLGCFQTRIGWNLFFVARRDKTRHTEFYTSESWIYAKNHTETALMKVNWRCSTWVTNTILVQTGETMTVSKGTILRVRYASWWPSTGTNLWSFWTLHTIRFLWKANIVARHICVEPNRSDSGWRQDSEQQVEFLQSEDKR